MLPAFQPASVFSLGLFIAVVSAVIGMWVWALWRAEKKGLGKAVPRIGALIGVWFFLSLLVLTGVTRAWPVPGALIFFFGSNVAAVFVACSRIGADLTRALSVTTLVAFQAFRLPLEYVLHLWAQEGVIPETMSWHGQNLDFITGVVAILCAPFAARSKAAAWIANGVGMVLLVNVARVAMLSAPVPWGWALERPLLLPYHFPYALIVPVCVASALAGHLILARQLLSRR